MRLWDLNIGYIFHLPGSILLPIAKYAAAHPAQPQSKGKQKGFGAALEQHMEMTLLAHTYPGGFQGHDAL